MLERAAFHCTVAHCTAGGSTAHQASTSPAGSLLSWHKTCTCLHYVTEQQPSAAAAAAAAAEEDDDDHRDDADDAAVKENDDNNDDDDDADDDAADSDCRLLSSSHTGKNKMRNLLDRICCSLPLHSRWLGNRQS